MNPLSSQEAHCFIQLVGWLVSYLFSSLGSQSVSDPLWQEWIF